MPWYKHYHFALGINLALLHLLSQTGNRYLACLRLAGTDVIPIPTQHVYHVIRALRVAVISYPKVPEDGRRANGLKPILLGVFSLDSGSFFNSIHARVDNPS